MAKSWKSN